MLYYNLINNMKGAKLVKKSFFMLVVLLLFFNCSVFANENMNINYSLMDAPLTDMVFETQDFIEPAELPSVFALNATVEDIIYNSFYLLAPENIASQPVGKFVDGEFYVPVRIPIAFVTKNVIDSSNRLFNAELKARAEEISEVFSRFLADNPEYFHLRPRSYGYNFIKVENTQYNVYNVIYMPIICYDFPDFNGSKGDMAEIKTKYENMMNVINSIAESLCFDGMTDLDRLLLAHDYIIDKNAYYLTTDEAGKYYYGDGYSYSPYGIFMNKQGVCQGLSYAYPALLKAMGFPIENIRQIRSPEMKHMWNFVKLGDNWYHVDLTWDDPCVVDNNGVYDMNKEDYQMEYHDCFLMSNDKNTEKRNSAGYENFTTEILGFDDEDVLLADDDTYESGYMFNDPIHINSTIIPGRVEYQDGYYKKYYTNNNVYFNYDTLKASPYAVSQAFDGTVVFLGSKSRTVSNLDVSFYVCYYDKDGRFIETERVNETIKNFGKYPININKPAGTALTKIITVNINSITPIANVPVIE